MSCSVSATRAFAVPGLLLLLVLTTVLSLVIGAKSLPASVVLDALTGSCQSADCTIVLDARLPRTLAGLLAGGALGLAGALMQTLTRNPLADPVLILFVVGSRLHCTKYIYLIKMLKKIWGLISLMEQPTVARLRNARIL